MNYKGKKVAITGVDGFIGKALFEALINSTTDLEFMFESEVMVHILDGDIRDPETFAKLDHTYDYLFHFAAPSSQVLFKRNPAYCIETTLKGIMNAAQVCRDYGIRLIYPSTGLLSSDRYNEYAMCKKISEDYVKGLKMDALGVRIFATYGPGEGHKADFASVPYLFARDMVRGKDPVIFGDGEQVRDFMYIDDVVQAILYAAEECYDDVLDIGSGHQISFNRIITELAIITETAANPDYIPKPNGYVKETAANPTRMYDFYKPKVAFVEGLKKTVESIKNETDDSN